ncbi:MAG TPA: hypothetical protein VM141_12020 [Planctomycetota bacterium]|nr:hypothetical protein [Planctomycetota bacterium]
MKLPKEAQMTWLCCDDTLLKILQDTAANQPAERMSYRSAAKYIIAHLPGNCKEILLT